MSSLKSCEQCGASGNTIFYPDASGGEYYCAACSQKRGLIFAAEAHLQALLEAVLTDWLLHWHHAGAPMPDLAEAVEPTMMRVDLPLPERRAWAQEVLKRQRAAKSVALNCSSNNT